MSPSRPHAPRPSGGSSSRPSGRTTRPNSGQVRAAGNATRSSGTGSVRPTPGSSAGSTSRSPRATTNRGNDSSSSATGRSSDPQGRVPNPSPRSRPTSDRPTQPRPAQASKRTSAEAPGAQGRAGAGDSSGSSKRTGTESVAAYEVGAPLNRSFGLLHNTSVRVIAVTFALIMGVVVLAPVARNYVKQYNANADISEQIAEQQRKNESLRNELSRWEDDSYVIAQARERLTFVFPDETPYRVMGWDPEDLTSAGDIPMQPAAVESSKKVPWYEDVLGSIQRSADLSDKELGTGSDLPPTEKESSDESTDAGTP